MSVDVKSDFSENESSSTPSPTTVPADVTWPHYPMMPFMQPHPLRLDLRNFYLESQNQRKIKYFLLVFHYDQVNKIKYHKYLIIQHTHMVVNPCPFSYLSPSKYLLTMYLFSNIVAFLMIEFV